MWVSRQATTRSRRLTQGMYQVSSYLWTAPFLVVFLSRALTAVCVNQGEKTTRQISSRTFSLAQTDLASPLLHRNSALLTALKSLMQALADFSGRVLGYCTTGRRRSLDCE